MKEKVERKVQLFGVIGILVLALVIFLFSGNVAGGVTGLEFLKAQDGSYFSLPLVSLVLAAAAIVFGVFKYRKNQHVGKLIITIIVAVVILAIGFGKIFTDKDNEGVTAPSGRIEVKQ